MLPLELVRFSRPIEDKSMEGMSAYASQTEHQKHNRAVEANASREMDLQAEHNKALEDAKNREIAVDEGRLGLARDQYRDKNLDPALKGYYAALQTNNPQLIDMARAEVNRNAGYEMIRTPSAGATSSPGGTSFGGSGSSGGGLDDGTAAADSYASGAYGKQPATEGPMDRVSIPKGIRETGTVPMTDRERAGASSELDRRVNSYLGGLDAPTSGGSSELDRAADKYIGKLNSAGTSNTNGLVGTPGAGVQGVQLPGNPLDKYVPKELLGGPSTAGADSYTGSAFDQAMNQGASGVPFVESEGGDTVRGASASPSETTVGPKIELDDREPLAGQRDVYARMAPGASKGAPAKEITELTPQQEVAFQQWAHKLGIRDVDHPDSHYDYRGAFLAGVKPGPDGHWPDTYKQHGHPTFSNESRYSSGDGGSWQGDRFVPPSGGRVYEMVDRNGNVMHRYDLTQETRSAQAKMERVFAPFLDSDDPVHREVANSVQKFAREISDVYGNEEAIKMAQTLLDHMLGHEAQWKNKRQAQGAAGRVQAGGMTKWDRDTGAKIGDEVRKWVQSINGIDQYKTVNEDLRNARMGLSALDANNGGGDTMAMKQVVRALNGANSSDKEFNQINSMTGTWGRLQADVMKLTDGGRLPEELRQALREHFSRLAMHAEEKRRYATQQVESVVGNQARLMGASPEQTDIMIDMGLSAIGGASAGAQYRARAAEQRQGSQPAKPGARPAQPAAKPAPAAPAPQGGDWRARARAALNGGG